MIEREKSPEELAILDRLRQLCAALPEAEESVDGHGHTSFRVAGKPFVMMGSLRLLLLIKTDPITQAALVRTGRWEAGQHGWVRMSDFSGLDWAEVEELVRDGYRLAAPRRLARGLPE